MGQDGGAPGLETRQLGSNLDSATELSKQPKEGQGICMGELEEEGCWGTALFMLLNF